MTYYHISPLWPVGITILRRPFLSTTPITPATPSGRLSESHGIQSKGDFEHKVGGREFDPPPSIHEYTAPMTNSTLAIVDTSHLYP